jgi:hypothetical protein
VATKYQDLDTRVHMTSHKTWGGMIDLLLLLSQYYCLNFLYTNFILSVDVSFI